jgi:hypothetical protein
MSTRKCVECGKRKDVEKDFGNGSAMCNKCTLRKCTVCQERKDVKNYYKSNPTTCKDCVTILVSNRRRVGMVSMHDKVDKMLERQQTCVEQLTKQMAVMQDLANKVARMDKEMAKLTKKVKKITMDQ